MSDTSKREAEEAAFKEHEAPSWDDDPVGRDAALRWHMRGFEAGVAFEQAHTPTAGSCWDEAPTIAPQHSECAPAPALCELAAGHMGAHRAGRTEWMRRPARRGTTAHTPTDDEREALIEEATWVLIDWDTDIVDRGVRDEHYRERRADVERVFPILFRRPVQGEPTAFEKRHADHEHVGPYCMPQGEPTDAQVSAAVAAINAEGFVLDRRGVRAALRAAAAVAEQGGENRG